MLGVPGTGPYGRMRFLRESIKADEAYLKTGIPMPRERKRLKLSVERERKELKELRARIRAGKEPKFFKEKKVRNSR